METNYVEFTVQLPKELVQDVQEFDILTSEAVGALIRADVDRQVMALVSQEIQANRHERIYAAIFNGDTTNG